jgi:hypothetical protein
MTPTFTAIPLAISVVLTGCGGKSKDDEHPTSVASLRLQSAPASSPDALSLRVEKVEIKGNGGWKTLSEPKRNVPIDLAKGFQCVLADGKHLRLDDYKTVRIILGDENYIHTGNQKLPLKVPDTFKQGIEVPLEQVQGAQGTYDLLLSLDPARSVQKVALGDGRFDYYLRPFFRLSRKDLTGAAQGVVNDPEGKPLPGIWVYAERLEKGEGDQMLQPRVLAKTRTKWNGHYDLDGLPFDEPFHLVFYGRVGNTGYRPQVTPALTLSQPDARCVRNCQLETAPLGEGIKASVQAPAEPVEVHNLDRQDVLDLVLDLDQDTGSGHVKGTFVVDSGLPSLAENRKAEWTTGKVPEAAGATYRVRRTPSFHGMAGAREKKAPVPECSEPCAVEAGRLTEVTFAYR